MGRGAALQAGAVGESANRKQRTSICSVLKNSAKSGITQLEFGMG